MLRNDLMTQFNALLPGHSAESGASRRTAMKAALGVGYAAAALPIMAQTAIKTSSEGLKTGQISYERGNRPTAANRAEETLRAFVVAKCKAVPLKTDKTMVRNARV